MNSKKLALLVFLPVSIVAMFRPPGPLRATTVFASAAENVKNKHSCSSINGISVCKRETDCMKRKLLAMNQLRQCRLFIKCGYPPERLGLEWHHTFDLAGCDKNIKEVNEMIKDPNFSIDNSKLDKFCMDFSKKIKQHEEKSDEEIINKSKE